jgi:hypothetical protein
MHDSSGETFFTVNLKGAFPVLFPGQLRRFTSATFKVKVRVASVPHPTDGRTPHPGSVALHGGLDVVRESIALTLRIFTPDGQEFTANKITLADLRKFRDLRGFPSGRWSYHIDR